MKNIKWVFFRHAAINNSTKLRRILVRLQGASKGAYSLYVTFDATQKAEQKTSKMGELFFAACLIVYMTIVASDGLAFFGAKFEPQDGKIYHGAQAEVRPVTFFKRHIDWDGLRSYSKACGKEPRLIMHYISLDPVAFWLLKSTILEIANHNNDYIPQIGMDFYVYSPSFNILKPHDITEKIAIGAYDVRIEKLAEFFKETGKPVFFRPGYEFGGKGHGRYASKQYWKQAWKRIYNIFQNEKANNVAFVWNTFDAADYMEYYPGDNCVDWWGINIFLNHADRNEYIIKFIKDAYNHRKPVMIAESTPRYSGSAKGREAWEKWYEPYFNLISKYKNIKAFCYINASWKDFPVKSFPNDSRIQINDYVKHKYREMLSDDKFIHSKIK